LRFRELTGSLGEAGEIVERRGPPEGSPFACSRRPRLLRLTAVSGCIEPRACSRIDNARSWRVLAKRVQRPVRACAPP
jgi:hypothetical protein